MKDRILRLCRRLDKFTLDEISTIAEDIDESVLELLLLTLVQEGKLIFKDNIYLYNKEQGCNKQRLPQFFQHHSKTDIDYIIKGFCIDIEVLKMIDLFGFSKHVMNNFYQYFRTIIYEQQKNELVKYFEKYPKIPQERIYMNTKVYLYLYEHKLFVSDKYLISKDARKHTNDERLEIKNIYLRSYRKVLSRSFAHRFHLHLAEELWKYGKDFSERYSGINTLLFA